MHYREMRDSLMIQLGGCDLGCKVAVILTANSVNIVPGDISIVNTNDVVNAFDAAFKELIGWPDKHLAKYIGIDTSIFVYNKGSDAVYAQNNFGVALFYWDFTSGMSFKEIP